MLWYTLRKNNITRPTSPEMLFKILHNVILLSGASVPLSLYVFLLCRTSPSLRPPKRLSNLVLSA